MYLCLDTGSPSSIYEQPLYMLTFALLRDSSDLHIYKDLYGENNDCFFNLWKCSDLNKYRHTLLTLQSFAPFKNQYLRTTPGVEVIWVSGRVAKLTFDRLGNAEFEQSLSMA